MTQNITCDCGAPHDGKWADVHTQGCAVVVSPLTEARHDVADYMTGMPAGYTGTFEAIHQIMFGPLKFNAHVRAFRAHQRYIEQKRQLADADIAVRAECERQMEEFRAKYARNNPSYSIAAE